MLIKMHKYHSGESLYQIRIHSVIVQIVGRSVDIQHTRVLCLPFRQTEVTNQQDQQHYPANRNELTRFHQVFPPANITSNP